MQKTNQNTPITAQKGSEVQISISTITPKEGVGDKNRQPNNKSQDRLSKNKRYSLKRNSIKSQN